MAVGSEFGLNFVYLLFLLLPGFVAVKAFLRANRRLDDLSRLDKIVCSIAGGLGSLAVLLVLYRIGPELTRWTITQPWPAINSSPELFIWFRESPGVDIASVGDMTVLALVVAIGTQTAIAATLGGLLGALVSILSREPKQSKADLEQPWDAAFQSSKQGDRVTVITRNGTEINGVVHRIGSPSENYDLLLRRSREIVRVGNSVSDERRLANVTYHHHDDISRIYFHDSPGIEELEPPGRLFLLWREVFLLVSSMGDRTGEWLRTIIRAGWKRLSPPESFTDTRDTLVDSEPRDRPSTERDREN